MMFFVTLSYGQQHVCGVSHADQEGMISMIEEFNKRKADEGYVRSADPLYVPIKFHTVADNDGVGRVKSKLLLKQMAVLIEDFKKVGMYLYIDDYEFNMIDNSSIYNSPGTFEPTIVANKDNNAVNIFVTENANTSSGQGTVLGFYSPSGDYVIIRINDVDNATSSLSHELGHLFSLPHTFRGWEGFEPPGGSGWTQSTFDGQYTGTNAPGTNIQAEVVNGTNCTAAADRICDTPPDYNFGYSYNGCNFDLEILDRNGDLIEPMERNFMGYFIDCAPYEFTQGQIDIMHNDYNSPSRANIRKSYIPDTTEIISNHEIVKPTQNQQLDFYNDVSLEWTPAEGASRYLITITPQGESAREYYSETNSIVIDELVKDKFHFWEVTPFNDGYTDTESKSSFFTTGSVTSTKESSIIKNVNVYPNPSAQGNYVSVLLSMEKDLDVAISLVDITGNTVLSQVNDLRQGENTLKLDTQELSKGIYILKMDTEDGSSHKKLIIQ